jgi:hypothetical protein
MPHFVAIKLTLKTARLTTDASANIARLGIFMA